MHMNLAIFVPVKGIYLIAGLVFSTGILNAQDPLVTDRPDQTESALVVPARKLQIETGLSREWNETGGDLLDEETRYGTTLLRYGLFDFLELRLGSDLLRHRYTLPAGARQIDKGLSPIGVGFKIELAHEDGLIPDIALLTDWQIPGTGDPVYSSDKWHHSFVFSFGHSISDRWGLAYNLGYGFEGGFDASAFKYTLTGGYAFSERWGGYIELYGSRTTRIPWDQMFDAGLTFLLFPNFQLDLSGGLGLAEISPAGYLSTGFSWRIPE